MTAFLELFLCLRNYCPVLVKDLFWGSCFSMSLLTARDATSYSMHLRFANDKNLFCSYISGRLKFTKIWHKFCTLQTVWNSTPVKLNLFISLITRTDSVEDPATFLDSIIHYHYVNYIFSQCTKWLGLPRRATISFSSTECLQLNN
jgi:hypothetical protein